ncbi:ammonia monooxygenase [Pararhizobium antarcticum]|uniref:Ammonia monooxygenase n=2 Tax=Pararhizobium antarcticum TaxID=1798805 RepID=A0A657LVT1_9HYPH|nr:AbrB family transcriptional regulator [Pararhizobium antarcticum]OJF92034.1 ammonia monooxygenase [Rhizobium sp. 58]OJF96069.1 ammonia monooxygenase [Pararhizobium antarcticum]
MPPPPLASGIGRWPPVLQWAALLVLSLGLSALLELSGLPAALLMGPMVAAAIVGINGGTIRLPRPLYLCAQALIGMMVAGAIDGGIVSTFLDNWPLFLGIVFSVIAMSTLSGFTLSRLNILPGTTAIWGTSAGAASAMVVMADAFGADTRLVAFMQYLRVLCVAAAASIVAHLWVDGDAATPAIVWFGAIDTVAFAKTLAVAAVGAVAGRLLRIPAGIFLVPFIAGTVLSTTGHLAIELPEWLLALGYAMLGWNIGLGFTRPILAHARRALLPILLSIAFLMGFCGCLAYLLTRFAGIDALTAYLATSPGGMDSIAIIAASSNVDVSFVMALQTARLLMIMAFGPALARFVAHKAGGRERRP